MQAQALENKDAEFVFNSLADWEPMQSVLDIVGDRIEFLFRMTRRPADRTSSKNRFELVSSSLLIPWLIK